MRSNLSLRRLAAASTVTLALLVTGCGGGSGSSSTGTTEAGSAELSAQFLRPESPNNKYVTFGSEGSAPEREAASKVLDENLEARASASFQAQCATLDLKEAEEVAEEKGEKARKGCPKALKRTAEPLKSSKQIRANPLSGPITAFRMEGSKAYALFHGNDQIDYAVPMSKEDGTWRVGAILLTELGKSQKAGKASAATPEA